ncbi:MAG: polysaccharide biosynthesis/export family protein [Nibricoccus sp.]
MRSSRHPLFILAVLIASASVTCAQDANVSGKTNAAASKNGTNNPSAPTAAPLIMATDPGYRLSLGDEISINVHGEEDLSTAQRIDKKGAVRMYLINEITLADKTVREAESFIEQTLVERKLLKKPLVSITVRDYATNEVTLTGRGVRPGVFPLPKEVASIEIVELITRYGGFTPNAESDKVKVYHKDETGREQSTTVNVEAMLQNRKNALKSFPIYPGDRIYVDERLF